MAEQEVVQLSEEVIAGIEAALAKFPPDQRRSAVMESLTLAQNANKGSLTVPIMDAIAKYLRIPAIAVYEVASFYSMYELKPVGKHKICVCTNVSCMLCGSDGVVEHLKSKLGIGFGETTADGKFTLKEVECLAACGGAPMMQIGDDYHENLTPERIDTILANLE